MPTLVAKVTVVVDPSKDTDGFVVALRMIEGPEMPPQRVMVCVFGVASSEMVKVV